MAVVLKDVAELAGVSVPAVSLVLNGRGHELKLSEDAIHRVRAAAKKLGYRANYHARSLRTGRTLTLGVLALASESFLTNRFWSIVAAGVDHAARSHGYHVLLVGGHADDDPVAATGRMLEERRMDALLIFGLAGAVPRLLSRAEVPLVVVGGAPTGKVHRVRFDPVPGIEAALDHLHALGHRRLLYIDVEGPQKPPTGERNRVLLAGAEARGQYLVQASIPYGGYDPAFDWQIAGYRAGIARLGPLPDVSAILCWNDSVALALMSILAERGIAVPGGCAVVGFDDLHAVYSVPPLTTVSHALPELGRRGVELALALLRGERTPLEAVVPASLVVRGSTEPGLGPARR